ncbi:MAG: hypothetical protein H0U36_08250 [Nocardioidaceae bacterium]|nr:hypothetical protein [Nocardioidaceae bacterium]
MSTPVGVQGPVGSASGVFVGRGFFVGVFEGGAAGAVEVAPGVGECRVRRGCLTTGSRWGLTSVVGLLEETGVRVVEAPGAAVSFASPGAETSHQTSTVTISTMARSTSLRAQYTRGGRGPEGRMTVLTPAR